jgi:4-hydroxy-tetrahydrodipicolinate reductase
MEIIVSGCCGTMGHVLLKCAAGSAEYHIAAGVDSRKENAFPIPIFSAPEEINRKIDVLIDFSNPSLLPSLLAYGTHHQVPLVLCTTGYSKEQIKDIETASKEVPIFFSSNMSLGINLLIELAKTAAKVLGESFDIEIVEKHHNQKVDAPSGTALMIADGISSVLKTNMHYVYDRHSQRKKREHNEIGIHSIRGGTIVGEHDVIFAGPQEVLTISHSAQSKDIFALGALHAASFLIQKAPGLYRMSDMIK